MNKLQLILYTRKGCCLCEGLEKRLKKISLKDLNPPLELYVIDIDSPAINDIDRNRYDLRVPVLLIGHASEKNYLELPRVSPRLDEPSLFEWLQRLISKSLF